MRDASGRWIETRVRPAQGGTFLREVRGDAALVEEIRNTDDAAHQLARTMARYEEKMQAAVQTPAAMTGNAKGDYTGVVTDEQWTRDLRTFVHNACLDVGCNMRTPSWRESSDQEGRIFCATIDVPVSNTPDAMRVIVDKACVYITLREAPRPISRLTQFLDGERHWVAKRTLIEADIRRNIDEVVRFAQARVQKPVTKTFSVAPIEFNAPTKKPAKETPMGVLQLAVTQAATGYGYTLSPFRPGKGCDVATLTGTRDGRPIEVWLLPHGVIDLHLGQEFRAFQISGLTTHDIGQCLVKGIFELIKHVPR